MKIKSLSVLLLMVPMFMFSQTKEERAKIASFSNKESNAVLAQQLKEEDYARKIRLNNYLQNNPTVNKVVVDDKGGIIEIIDVLPNGEIIYAKTDNAGSAITARATSLYSGGSLGLNIQGQNMIAGVWDGGSARNSHQEFMVNNISKIDIVDGSAMAEHATHVTGTIAAQGIVPLVRGVAFNSSIKSYDWTGDLTEMLTEASTGLLVSNHSYGIGSLGSIWFYGAYDSRARQMDNITYNNPFYLPVISAGNDRGATDTPGSTQNAAKAGYDLIFGHANAKNVLTVAAIGQVSAYTGPASVVMSSFSSWGPTDDGRIKPEISMKGVQVRSTLDTSDTAVGFMSGTSMASPGVTGVVLLLQQYYNQLYSNYMKAATTKGLILHTADEAGDFVGPDYSFGWGLINAENAAKVIRDKNLVTNKSIVEELTLNNGGTFTKTILATGTEPLKVSISWTDPAYPGQNNGDIDPTTKYLVNDLDVKVTNASATVYYPWKLQGMAAFYDAASNNSTNNVDTFERVDINNPVGLYTITVTHKGTLVGGSQNFTLIATSNNLTTLSANETESSDKQLQLYPNPAQDFIYIKNNNSVEANISILDVSGRVVLKQIIHDGKINIKGLVKGNYILVYRDKKGREVSLKFIKSL
ncbi:S8 family serine peptidase [Chryseobacterium sp.]|uniref:S8 family serine peptidase n=1 Tax=Chryseobacterium sp. TaxID=1871047 RepID=UPI0011CC99FA|nr:S8 family serine peptidase [Chryseobacterium sp.]TXF76227.1 S8 family serine peptidase [Chryseobacterium sp.]